MNTFRDRFTTTQRFISGTILWICAMLVLSFSDGGWDVAVVLSLCVLAEYVNPSTGFGLFPQLSQNERWLATYAFALFMMLVGVFGGSYLSSTPISSAVSALVIAVVFQVFRFGVMMPKATV